VTETVDSGVEYRELSTRQLAELRGYVSPVASVVRTALFLVAVGIAALVLRVIVSFAAPGPVLPRPVWWVAPTALLAWMLYRRSLRWTGGPAFRARVRRDVSRGQLAARRIDVVDAVAVQTPNDDGACYLLLTSKGQTLLFDGQWLEGYRRKGFPWASFEIKEAPDSRVFFGLRLIGERLTPSATVAPMSFAERRALGSFNKKYQPVDVDFAALKTRGSSGAIP